MNSRTPLQSPAYRTKDPPDAVPAANGKPVPDRELLRRFVRRGDQAAFAALVRRHSGLVIGVCRRVLRSEHDIEDAFQATFLVLARDAGRIRKSDSLASWLHGVAYRTSLRAADSTRRRGRLLRELTMTNNTHLSAEDNSPLADVEQRHQQQALDEELASLADNYRAALVLHYLDGKNNQQVADELGLSVTAVEGRLKRGKKELRLRLARRGIGLSVAVAAMQAVQSSAQAAPLEHFIARAIDAGLSYAGGEAAGPVYSPEAARLAGQELMTMSTTTTATLAAALLLPMALSFAGHAPVAGPAGSTGPATEINTTLAQIESGEVSAAEVVQPAPGGADTADLVAEDAASQNVNEFEVMAVDEEAGKVTISYLKDGVVHTRVVDLAREEAASNLDPPMTGSGYGIVGAMGMMEGYGAGMAGAGMGMMAGDGLAPAPAGIRDYTDTPGSEQRIADQLKLTTEVEFIQTPLSDAMDFLASLHDIRIMVDEPALNDVGVPTDEPVNLVLSGASLQSAMNLILEPKGLTTIIRDEVLQITTKEVADNYLVTRVYDISDLAGIEQEQLLKALQESLPDADWMETDGAGGTATILSDALVIKQSQSAHRQIVDLLEQLGRHLQQRPPSQTSVRTYEAAEAASRKNLTLHIDADGNAHHDGEALTAKQMEKLLQREQPSVLILHAHPSASSETVKQIIDAAAANVEGIRFALKALDSAADLPAAEATNDVSDAGGIPTGWQAFSDGRLTSLLEDEKPVLVNFTADWCLVCKQNEKQALYTTATTDLLQRHGITALRADYTQPDDEIKALLERFDTESVPLAVVFPKGEPDHPIVLNGAITQEKLLATLRSAAGSDAAEEAEAGLSLHANELTLQVDADGTAHHDGNPVSIAQLQELVRKEQPSVVILRVDRSASSQAVSDIVSAAQTAGVAGMKFAIRAMDPPTGAAAVAREPE